MYNKSTETASIIENWNEDINRAEDLILENKLDSAKEILNLLLQANPGNIYALNNLAIINLLQANYPTAELIINKTLELDPKNEIALNNLEVIRNSKDLLNIPQPESQNEFLSNSKFEENFPAGHFYSPIPEMNEIIGNYDLLVKYSGSVNGIIFNEKKQIDLFNKLSNYFYDLPFEDGPKDNFRYYFKNGYFQHGDAVIAQAIMRHFKPREIIEIGSGFSSALMLDISGHKMNSSIKFSFIEPHTQRLMKLLSKTDQAIYSIIERRVQEVPLDIYKSLNEGDILFVDSSHIVKIGSDVNFIISEVFPILKKGVIVHIHDIFYPFQYPQKWFMEGRAWNEAYFIKAFLQYNDTFSILFFNNFMQRFYSDEVFKKLPDYCTDCGCGLWLIKEK